MVEWGVRDAPGGPGWNTGEWDVGAPSPTVGTHMVERGVFDAPGGVRVENGGMGRRGRCPLQIFCFKFFISLSGLEKTFAALYG